MALGPLAAQKMLADFVAPYDAHVVSRCQQAGLISLGKLNMDEFAMGSSNENSFFGAVRNPWDPSHVPGEVLEGQRRLLQLG
jgi:Asp-tRNAAsn/Glu-tRNAGln amidotransferase A subunit and related amidases